MRKFLEALKEIVGFLLSLAMSVLEFIFDPPVAAFILVTGSALIILYCTHRS